jgi:ATP-dependent Zn protease
VDSEVESVLGSAYSKAEEILSAERKAMDRLAEKLMNEDEVPGEEVYALIKDKREETYR